MSYSDRSDEEVLDSAFQHTVVLDWPHAIEDTGKPAFLLTQALPFVGHKAGSCSWLPSS